MKILIVYDSYITARELGFLHLCDEDEVCLFALTSKKSITDRLIKIVGQKASNFEILPSARMINSAADTLRDRYIKFIADFPELVYHNGRNLKEFFAVDKYVTQWWFSLVAEKNTFKSDAFNRLAQLNALIDIIKEGCIQKIIFLCKNKKLKRALSEYSLKHKIYFTVFPSSLLDQIKSKLLNTQKIYYFIHLLFLLDHAGHLVVRFLKIKRKLHLLKRERGSLNKTLLVITPYPHIDITLAQQGIFKNRFYPYLQQALEEKGHDIVWVAIYVDNSFLSFEESIDFTQRFIKNGYTIFFLEEFASVAIYLKVFFSMLIMGWKYLSIEKAISRLHRFDDYNFYPILREDWYLSFVGTAGYSNLLYYMMFKSLFNGVKAKQCLYLCEMQTWEKALISARDSIGYAMPLYGYQSGTVSRMLLNYFNYYTEINDNRIYAMPRPDRIICNGLSPYIYMKDSGWPEERLSIVEAIRYNHLKEYMKSSRHQKKNIVLLAFSISPEESSSLLNMVYESFKDDDVEVWMKPHPFLKVEDVFKLSGLSKESICFRVRNDSIEELLSIARVVIVGQSGVSIQALLYGCEVLILNVPERINMSPLKNTKSTVIKSINSPEELKKAVISAFNEKYNPEKYLSQGRSIVNEHFYLNQETDIPYRFLTLLHDKEL